MVIAVTTEHRFFRTPDGAIWTDGLNPLEFWERYLEVFTGVKVIARVQDVPSRQLHYRRADGRGVTFNPVPNYLGPWEYLGKAVRIRRALRRAVAPADAVILRVSSHLAGCLEPFLTRTGHPYGVEVVNDPFDVFAPGAVRYRMRPIFRWWFTGQLRRQCRAAKGAAYVTERALQSRYPCDAFSTGLSDVEISQDATLEADAGFRAYARPAEALGTRPRFHIVTVASLAQMYKAPDVLIRAVADCIHTGWQLTLHIVGEGRHRSELEHLASTLGVRDSVEFLGQLPPGAAVREQLDRADLFVLASRCEGLPRAMVEAMARSLPCIGSQIGGIPELLAPEDLVAPGDATTLAEKIREVLGSRQRLSTMSARNFRNACRYRDSMLGERRRTFFEHIRRTTSEWLQRPCLTKSHETAEVISGG